MLWVANVGMHAVLAAALGRLELIGCSVLRSCQQAGCSFRLQCPPKHWPQYPSNIQDSVQCSCYLMEDSHDIALHSQRIDTALHACAIISQARVGGYLLPRI